MKELLEYTNKTEWITTMIYRVSTFACWYLFAYIFSLFINGSINDFKLIVLVVSIIITYSVRLFFKSKYKAIVNESNYNLKHSIEMYYFTKLKNISYDKCEQIDKEELGNRIIEVAYNYTKIISDIGEYLIPAAIGVFIMFIKLLSVNIIFGIVALISLVGILIFSYYGTSDEELPIKNNNVLLKEFVRKIYTIKKQNIFNYCVETLNSKNENDAIILRSDNTKNDCRFNRSIFVYLCVILICTFIFIRNTITRLGTIIFLIIIIVKLAELLYEVTPAIKNMFLSSKNKTLLDEYFKETCELVYQDDWKVINIKGGLVNYKDTTQDIKIPSFELDKKDHILIMGKSGQGKSTVLNVLSGIFKLDKGTISYDGNESTSIVDAVYVSSNADIFNMTLRDNIKTNTNKTDEEILTLIKEINLDEWYNSLSKGLDTILTDDINPIVKLKINLLRAIAMEKNTYFLDEPTLDFDMDSEKKFANMLKKRLKDKTYILVSKSTVITSGCKKHYFIKDHTLLESEPLL